jgi:U4/U6.U5 tri-snRNP-associated protein 3
MSSNRGPPRNSRRDNKDDRGRRGDGPRNNNRNDSPNRRHNDNDSRHNTRNRDYNRGSDSRHEYRRDEPDEEQLAREREREALRGVGFGQRSEFLEKKKKEEAEHRAANLTVDELASLQTPEEMAAVGLPISFGSTQGKHVTGANASLARVKKKREYRQYMNRKGGFNQLLENKQ